MVQVPTFCRITATAASDSPFKVVLTDMWFKFVDIFVLDNSLYMGDINTQDIPILANDIYYSLEPVNLYDLYFKNYTASSNTRIVIVGPLLTDAQKRELGIKVV